MPMLSVKEIECAHNLMDILRQTREDAEKFLEYCEQSKLTDHLGKHWESRVTTLKKSVNALKGVERDIEGEFS